MNRAIKYYFRSGHISMTPTLALSELAPSATDQAFYLDSNNQTHIVETFNGSAGLHQVATALDLQAGDVILLPAYCCGAELGPFLHQGCRCEFFDVDEQLNADIQQIEKLLTQYDKTKAVLVTHYFGFAQQNIEQLAELCKTRQVALIEDCAHALFSLHNHKALGSAGQYAVFSPRKSLPLTEGGLMLVNQTASVTPSTQLQKPALLPRWQRLFYSLQQNLRSVSPNEQAILINVKRRLLIALIAIPSIAIKLAKKLPVLNRAVWLSADAEGEEAVPIYSVGMSNLSLSLMKKANKEKIVSARRSNYSLWLELISQLSQAATSQALTSQASMDQPVTVETGSSIRPLLPELPEGCCPLYFPVVVKNPAAIKEYLADRDIECFNWWQHLHEAVDWTQFPVAERLKRSVIALPVHQNLSKVQIEYAAKCLQQSLVSV